jgi:glycerophosphoryl diester phosphodiesterase
MRHAVLVSALLLLAACTPDGIRPAEPTAPAAARAPDPARAEPTLLARAILPADAYQPGPPSGAFITGDNGAVPPFPGQPIPGFSAVLDAGRGQFWAMPDNGYGAKTNSADFLLRLYRIQPDFRQAGGGSGRVTVLRFLQLRDPDGRIPFKLARADRRLTGADFDLESVRQDRRGDLWFGEEFGPFILHTDATAACWRHHPAARRAVAAEPRPRGPDAWTVRASRGFEGMALSADGRTLYPILEGALRADPDPRRRVVYEFTSATAPTPAAPGSTAPTPPSPTR